MSFPIEKVQRELIPEATYVGTCIQIIDLGKQEMPDGDLVKRVRFAFELPTVRRTFDIDGEQKDLPAIIGREMTQNITGKKAVLRLMLESWGKLRAVEQEGGIGALVGASAMITVAHVASGDNVYDNVVAVAGVPEGMAIPDIESELVMYHLGAFDQDLHASLPEWLREKIEKSDTYREIALGRKASSGELDTTLDEGGL